MANIFDSELKVNVGETKLLLNQKISKILKVKTYNLLVYKNLYQISPLGVFSSRYITNFIRNFGTLNPNNIGII